MKGFHTLLKVVCQPITIEAKCYVQWLPAPSFKIFMCVI